MKRLETPKLVIVCAIFVLIFTNIFSYFIFDHIPHIPDEIDYLFQAKIFLLGKLYVKSPEPRGFFNYSHIINNGKWYSQYTPGFPLLMLLGLLIGAPWLINPLLASLSIFLFYLLGKQLYGTRIGILSAAFGAISIWFLIVSSTMLSHISCVFFLSIFLLFVLRLVKSPSVLNASCAGLSLSMSLLIRSYSTLVFAFPFLIFYAVDLLKNFRSKIKYGIVFASTGILGFFILMVYNFITNGHPLLMGYVVRYGTEVLPGFGRTGCLDIPFTPLVSVTQSIDYLKHLNTYLFGWPFSLVFVFIPLVLIYRKKQNDKSKDLLMYCGFFCFILGYFFYWGKTKVLGPRLYFEAIPFLIILSARGFDAIQQAISEKRKNLEPKKISTFFYLVLLALSLYAFFIQLPRIVWPNNTKYHYKTPGYNFAGVTAKINNTIASLPLSKALIIMKFLHSPSKFYPLEDWGSGFLFNNPNLTGKIVYARNQGKHNIKLFDYYPERNIFMYYGNLEKGILCPLMKKENKIIYGNPIVLSRTRKKDILLITDPRDFFVDYSTTFTDFIDQLFKKNKFVSIDASFLIDRGNFYIKQKNYKKSSLFYEAALQLEKYPGAKWLALNKLSTCYLKLGKRSEALKILAALSDVENNNLYSLFPTKGF